MYARLPIPRFLISTLDNHIDGYKLLSINVNSRFDESSYLYLRFSITVKRKKVNISNKQFGRANLFDVTLTANKLFHFQKGSTHAAKKLRRSNFKY